MTSQDFSNKDYLNKMKYVNESLGISDDFSVEKNKNIIFVYTPPKVGSTTLVSSIRINACGKFTVLHLHNEIMLKILYNINDVTVLDIIKYNNFLGKNVYVIDIYRSPIEQKISTFFENIHSFHFNVPVETLNTFDIERIVKRFNQVFPYLLTNDNFRTKYDVPFPEKFDFNRKFISAKVDGINYFKIRLKDSGEWRRILNNILGIEIYIANDYETNKKPINQIFSLFKQSYRIPKNLLEFIENDDSLKYYYSDYERTQYINSWKMKMNNDFFITFTPEEYVFYSHIALDNQYISEIQLDHYIDLGCLCMGCCRKRGLLLIKLQRGEQINEKINHCDAGADYLRAKAKRVPVYLKMESKNSRNIGILKSNFMKTFK
jgi:hypothetical protein